MRRLPGLILLPGTEEEEAGDVELSRGFGV